MSAEFILICSVSFWCFFVHLCIVPFSCRLSFGLKNTKKSYCRDILRRSIFFESTVGSSVNSFGTTRTLKQIKVRTWNHSFYHSPHFWTCLSLCLQCSIYASRWQQEGFIHTESTAKRIGPSCPQAIPFVGQPIGPIKTARWSIPLPSRWEPKIR